MTPLHRSYLLVLVVLAGCTTEDAPPPAPEPPPVEPIRQSGGHHVMYVPAYSHVYHGDRSPLRFRLTTTLSVHNISFRDSIWVHKIRYYDTDGELVRNFLHEPVPLRPMQTYKVRVTQRDTTRGAGANFLVEWEAGPQVPAPIVEAVHIGVSSTVGLSFVTRGVPLRSPVVPDDFSGPQEPVDKAHSRDDTP